MLSHDMSHDVVGSPSDLSTDVLLSSCCSLNDVQSSWGKDFQLEMQGYQDVL